MSKKFLMGAVAGLALSSAAAIAAPITTPPPALVANGDVQAFYVFADAGDNSQLSKTSPGSIQAIFDNKVNTAGDTVDLGLLSGNLVFGLNDITTGRSFLSTTPDVDGNYHALITNNFADFGITLSASDQLLLDAFTASNPSVTFVGWEDHTLEDVTHDFDYNDLIFAFSNTVRNTTVPEPLTLSIFGAGLIGAAGLRRRKKNAKA